MAPDRDGRAEGRVTTGNYTPAHGSCHVENSVPRPNNSDAKSRRTRWPGPCHPVQWGDRSRSLRDGRAATRRRFRIMSLPSQSVALLQAARDLVKSLPADAVLLLTETPIDWDEVGRMLAGC